ncbi:mycofactocin precursor MftA [Streptomyces sp. NPDC093591]
MSNDDDRTEPAPVLEDASAAELTSDDLIEEVSIDGMCGVY